MRLIDGDALMADIERTIENSGCVNHEGDIMDCVRYAPEVDAVPVVRGEWVYTIEKGSCCDHHVTAKCSECGWDWFSADLQINLSFDEFNRVTDALNRLADYEDTGLSPEEVQKARAQLKTLQEAIRIKGGNEHYPTEYAYLAACAAIEKLHTKITEVEAERDKAVADLKEALTSNRDETLCKYCKNYFECEGEKCPEFISGVGDAEGKYPTWKWSCMDFDYGECAILENTPCHACHDNAYDGFEWRGLAE